MNTRLIQLVYILAITFRRSEGGFGVRVSGEENSAEEAQHHQRMRCVG